MSPAVTRGLRFGGIGLVAIAALAWLGSARALSEGSASYGFDALAVGEPVYVSLAIAKDDVTIRWAEIEAVGPVEARLVRCPGEDQGAARDCRGGPLDAVGSSLAAHQQWDDPVGPSGLYVEVRRVEPGPAAVCSVRLLQTSGMRVGLQRLSARVGLPGLDDEGEVGDELTDAGWENPTDTMCE